jgi:hypothetical protein
MLAPGKKNCVNYLKKQVKRTGGIAQMGEHLPSKVEALSSNPNTPQKSPNKSKIASLNSSVDTGYHSLV